MTSSCSPPWRSNSIAARAWRVVRRRKERPEYAASRMSACRKWKPPGTSGSRSTNSASLLHAVGSLTAPASSTSGGDEVAGKRLAQNRGPAEKRPVGAVQPVDAACQHRFDRLRELVPRAVTCGARGDELLEEQRVAAGTGGDRVGLLVGDLRAGRTNERLGVVGREGLEPHGQRGHGRRSVGGGEPSRDGPPGRADEPGVRRQVPAEVAEELGRGLVHPVGVLEEERGRSRKQALEEGLDGTVESGATERRLELVHLTGRRDGDVERNREQGEPRHELGRDVVEATAEHAVDVGTRAVADTDDLAQELAESEVGRSGLVLLARPAQDRHPLRVAPGAPRAAATSRSLRRPRARRASRTPCGPARARPRAMRARAFARRAAHAGPGRPASPPPRPRRTVRPPRTCPSARTPAMPRR